MGDDMVRGEVRLRKAQAGDLPALVALEQANFSLPWSETGFQYELDSEDAAFTVAELAGELVGFIILHRAADEGEIYNIAVREDCRRLGIADRLMTDALHYAAAWRLCRVLLEVRQSNAPARALYRKHGFTVLGMRPNYYDDPREDAMIMELTLG